MLPLDSEQVPDASPDDLNGTCGEGDEIGISEKRDDAGRESDGPAEPHDKV
jgi:hypothetical protein